MSTHLCAKCASGLLPLSSSLNRSWQQENGPTRKDFGNIFSQKKTVVRFWDNFKYEKSPPVDPPPAVVRLGLNSSRCGKLPKCRPGYHCTLHCLPLHCICTGEKLERYHCCARLKCAQWNPICRDLNTSQRLQYSIFNSKLPS